MVWRGARGTVVAAVDGSPLLGRVSCCGLEAMRCWRDGGSMDRSGYGYAPGGEGLVAGDGSGVKGSGSAL